ncbi:chorismate synthase [Streptococcus pacificus]|uniref:Chorismate synthase n=1 Tax=Streptococcus pacificus TaxID=2740577 RepID=A0ABS0ZGW7_9STRE|nr:chorismate synthase [Streptococcus pacificus]MBJ8325232.1 chorismate synthase [Streptococcus pacificus]
MRYFTAGESHGPRLTAIIEGIPSGLSLSVADINKELKRRQKGYGRGARMLIESDQIEITSGVRHGLTLGSPITLTLTNKDFDHWSEVMAIHEIDERKKHLRQLTKPRPGHADLVGGMKYGFSDLRNTLERSSARETAMRVAIGAVAKRLLEELSITVFHHVTVFGGITIDLSDDLTYQEIKTQARQSDLSITNPDYETTIKDHIDKIKKKGDTLGGVIETIVLGAPAGLGSYVQWDRKLDGKIAQAVLSINAFKGVAFGLGFETAHLTGSQVMDEIIWEKETGYRRKTNRLGGFEGGMTNGQPLIIKGVMKPIPTLYKPLMTVDIDTHEPYKASVERSDTTALPAAGVVMENVIATVLATEILEQFSSDNMTALKKAFKCYQDGLTSF